MRTRSWVYPLAALAVLAGLGVLAVLAVLPPKARGTDAPASDFSAARAFAHVQQMGKETHPAGSPANDVVRDYLVTTLRGLGLDPQIQDTIGMESIGDGPVAAARVRNIVTEIPGADSTGRVILVAHYDSVQTGPGGNDDGAGVSAIVETTRALLTGPDQRNDIVLVLTDAEEACLCGAEAFVSQHPLARDGGVVLNVEARGSSGPAIMFETSAGNADLVSVYGKAVPYPVGTSFAVEVYRILPNDTDFSPFRDSGDFNGLNSAYIDGSAAYHKPQDTPDRMSKDSLQHHGDNLLALVRAFGSQDLAGSTAPAGGDATYFPVFGELLAYPGSLVLVVAGLALLAVIVLAVLAVRKGKTSLGKIAAAFGLTLVPIIVTVVAAQLFWTVLTLIRPGYANMMDPWRPIWYRWAIVALIAVIVLGFYAVVRRWLDRASISVGVFGWLAILGVVMGLLVPGGSYLTALPALAGAIAGIAALYLRDDLARVGVLALAGLVAVVVLAPTVTLFFPALGLETGAAPAFFAVLLGLALLPLLDKVPAIVWSLESIAIIMVILTGVGLAVDRFDARHPMPSQLMYALDADTGKAIWASSESDPGAWTKQYVSQQEDLEGVYPYMHNAWTGPAEVANLEPSEVTSVRDGNKLRVTIVPQRPARLIHFSTQTVISKPVVNGRPVPSREAPFDLLFHAPPSGGVVLEFEVSGPVTLRVIDGSDGLTGLPGFKPRPADVGVAGSHSTELVLVAKTHQLP
jgi:hypothetical protein